MKYKLCGIRSYGNGLFHREIKDGKNIKGKKLNKIKQNQYIYSRLGANNGSFDIVSKNFNDYYVSNEFPLFDFKDNIEINKNYFDLVLKLPKYWKNISKQLQGSVHKRFKEELFLNLKIPLPSLSEQEELLKAYNTKIELAKAQKTKAEKLTKSIEEYLINELGVSFPKKEKKDTFLEFIDFKDIIEWGVDKIKGEFNLISSKFDIINLQKQPDFIIDLFRGKSPKYDNTSEITILNQKCNRWNNIELEFAKKVKKDWINSISNNFFTKKGDILINSTGDGTIGRATLIKKDFENLLYDSHLLLLRLDKKEVNTLFFVYFFNSKFGQFQIEKIKSAQSTKQTELGIGNLKKILFPIPPLSKQNEIAEHINKLQTSIKQLQIESEFNRNTAIKDFESKLFVKNKSNSALKT